MIRHFSSTSIYSTLTNPTKRSFALFNIFVNNFFWWYFFSVIKIPIVGGKIKRKKRVREKRYWIFGLKHDSAVEKKLIFLYIFIWFDLEAKSVLTMYLSTTTPCIFYSKSQRCIITIIILIEIRDIRCMYKK